MQICNQTRCKCKDSIADIMAGSGKNASACMENLSLYFHSFPTPFSLSTSLILFVSSLSPHPSRNPAMSSLSGSGHSLVDKRFLVNSELKITLPVTALLQKFWHNQVCIVTRIGPATHCYGISQKRSTSMVMSKKVKWSHTQPAGDTLNQV